jgi:hypothetical protein
MPTSIAQSRFSTPFFISLFRSESDPEAELQIVGHDGLFIIVLRIRCACAQREVESVPNRLSCLDAVIEMASRWDVPTVPYPRKVASHDVVLRPGLFVVRCGLDGHNGRKPEHAY